MRKPSPVMVTWEDICTWDGGWEDHAEARQDAANRDRYTYYAAGFIVEKTKVHVLLTSLLDHNQGKGGPKLRIPTGCIRSIKRLK